MVLYLHRYTWLVIRPELAKEYGYTNTELEQIFALLSSILHLGADSSRHYLRLLGPEYF